MLLEEIQPKEGTPQEYDIYVDMDGVLADFVDGVNRLLDVEYSDEEYQTNPEYRTKMWKAVGRYSKEGGQLWAELKPMSDAKELWSYVEKHNPEILTAAGNPEFGAEAQKRQWVPWVMGSDIKVNVVRKSADKAQFATPNSILIDDQEKSIKPWVAAGGIGILHTSAANTINELKKLGI